MRACVMRCSFGSHVFAHKAAMGPEERKSPKAPDPCNAKSVRFQRPLWLQRPHTPHWALRLWHVRVADGMEMTVGMPIPLLPLLRGRETKTSGDVLRVPLQSHWAGPGVPLSRSGLHSLCNNTARLTSVITTSVLQRRKQPQRKCRPGPRSWSTTEPGFSPSSRLHGPSSSPQLSRGRRKLPLLELLLR